MKPGFHVAVMGAGIMGSATALLLAERGVRVTLFDAAERPFAAASRWNEGKIHLGYIYAADPTLDTVKRLLPGGIAFKDLTEHLIGCGMDEAITDHDDTFLVHRNSVTSAEATDAYFRSVASLIAQQPNIDRYLIDLNAAAHRRLVTAELESQYDTSDIIAGYRVPERSISTLWLADKFEAALRSTPKIEMAVRTRVHAVHADSASLHAPLSIETSSGMQGPFDFVVNALWQARLGIDEPLGVPPPAQWSHRYRLSVFLRTRTPVSVPSTLLVTGPFGDVKNYNDRDFYLSWYPSGLLAEGHSIVPPEVPSLDPNARKRIIGEVTANLGKFIRSIDRLDAQTEYAQLQGGWVYAAGRGSLGDPRSSLHRRDRIGIHGKGSYISVDTGKYSVAPWLARNVVNSIFQLE